MSHMTPMVTSSGWVGCLSAASMQKPSLPQWMMLPTPRAVLRRWPREIAKGEGALVGPTMVWVGENSGRDAAGGLPRRDRGQRAVDLARDGGDKVHLFSGAGHQDVEASPAAGLDERAELAAELAVLVGSVGRADDDVVTLVPLDVLEVLDE